MSEQSKQKDSYAFYGHSDSAMCVRKNNDPFFNHSDLENGVGSKNVTINGATFEVSYTKTKGYWEFATTFDSIEGVELIHKKAQKISETKMSDDTMTFNIPENYDLVIE
ncbi:MAG: hypothetical protein ACTSU7_01010 [Candidatus Heimdallarchaeaceae archaeon]